MKRLLIEHKEEAREMALMDEGRLLAFYQDEGPGPHAEEIYLGVVDRIVKGMEAAFVRLTKDTVGFLPFSECPRRPQSGDKLLVQVKRPPVGEKAAYMTADISLAGRSVILTPFSQKLSISKRIEDQAQRKRLLDAGKRCVPPGMGLVMRTEAAQAEEGDLFAEVQALRAAWEELSLTLPAAQAPCLVKGRMDALARLLRDERGGLDEALTDAPEKLPPLDLPVRTAPHPFDLYSVRSKLQKSLSRKVWLDCGGFLVIDRTEAMTVIDVNSGKYTGHKSGAETTFLRLNQEAAREIARLLRLRNVGGIVLIDFVDMQSDESREGVLAALAEALLEDPVKTVLHGFTSLGLMEMTRRKTHSDAPSPLPTCPRCHGTGIIEEHA